MEVKEEEEFDPQELFNKFADFAHKSGFNWYIPGEMAYMDTRNGNVMIMVSKNQVKLLKKGDVETAEFRDIEEEEIKEISE